MTTLTELVLQWGPHRGPIGPTGPMGPHWGGGTMPWGGMATGGAGLAWPLLWLLVAAAVTLAAVALLTWAGGDERTDDAVELLRERYARGDISEEEFETRAERLSGDGRGAGASAD